MNEKPIPLNEDDLHAYVDGRLNNARNAQVEEWLASDPDAAERVKRYRAQNVALQAMFNPVLDEPVPARLTATLTRKPKRMRIAIAAAVTWIILGGVVGFVARGWLAPSTVTRVLVENAAVAHAVYSVEVLHPVEVTADQEQHLVKWLSKRLGKPLHTPDFSSAGYKLVGGRLLPGERGPAAQFMYQEAGGERLTLYVSTALNSQATAFHFQESNGVNVLYWIDRDLGFALAGNVNRERLTGVANIAYQALGF